MESDSKFIRVLIIDVYHSHKCTGKFQVAEVKLNHRSKNGDMQGGNRSTEIVDEEVMSPASYVTTFICTQVVGDNIRHRQTNRRITSPVFAQDNFTSDNGSVHAPNDDNGTQFFRRIHIICSNNVVT
jgi:hypothetical protein